MIDFKILLCCFHLTDGLQSVTMIKSKFFFLNAIDRGNSLVQIFFSDFSKGFDMIDHSILIHCNFQGVIITPLVGLI